MIILVALIANGVFLCHFYACFPSRFHGVNPKLEAVISAGGDCRSMSTRKATLMGKPSEPLSQRGDKMTREQTWECRGRAAEYERGRERVLENADERN